MRILWIVNITMPDASEKLGMARPVIGGWLTGYQDALLSEYHDEIELHILQPALIGSCKSLITSHAATGAKIHHHIFPNQWLKSPYSFSAEIGSRLSPLSNQLAGYFLQINEEIRPDIVHLHGTEFPHSLLWVESCGISRTLVSIQGLTHVYARYYMGGLTKQEQRPSFHDLRYHCSLQKSQQELEQRGAAELRLLSQIEHVAGRTNWDYDHALTQNPRAKYHVLQEVLREPFYAAENQWNLANCHKHTIFVSQSHYPIKGLHKLLEALPLVLRQYPDTQIRIVGNDLTRKQWWQRSTYANALRNRIEHPSTGNSLRSHITFLGALSGQQMAEEYQKAHLFVCPSSIENSSNSVCEAQILGVPVIASYVGGMMDLLQKGEAGLLYRYEEVEMLAQAICKVFADDTFALQLSENEKEVAQQRHDRMLIAHTLYNIYREIAQ